MTPGKKPLVTVCVPTFNRSRDLMGTLFDLTQQQTFRDFEILISDDGSTDDTAQRVSLLDDPRIHYTRNARNIGLYANFDHLIRSCDSEFICTYHDHDIYLPTILQRSLELLKKYPTAQYAHTALLMVNQSDEPVFLDQRPFPEIIGGDKMRSIMARSLHSDVMAATTMVRREAYRAIGPFEFERFGLGCDKHMWFQLAALGDVAYISEPQALIRARTKEGTTSRFSWKEFLQKYKMAEDEIAACFHNEPSKRLRLLRELSAQRRKEAVKLFARAVLLEPQPIIAEGEDVMTTCFGARGRILTRLCMLPLTRFLLNVFGLSTHRFRVSSAYERNRKRAETYWRSKPQYSEYVVLRRRALEQAVSHGSIVRPQKKSQS